MSYDIPACATCARYHKRGGVTCDAFPVRIPDLIWLHGDPHTSPVEGDGGKLYVHQEPIAPTLPTKDQ